MFTYLKEGIKTPKPTIVYKIYIKEPRYSDFIFNELWKIGKNYVSDHPPPHKKKNKTKTSFGNSYNFK